MVNSLTEQELGDGEVAVHTCHVKHHPPTELLALVGAPQQRKEETHNVLKAVSQG